MAVGWKHRHALVTGGTGGLGRHVTAHLAGLGATVTVPYLEPADAEALRDHLGAEARGRVRLVEADLRQEAVVQGLVDELSELHAVVHLAGGFAMASLAEQDLEGFRAHHELNLTTTFLICKHTLPRMQQRGHGRIVTVGSQAAMEPGAGMAAYASAKAAVIALTRVLAAETKGTDVTANCVLPSIIDTPANRQAMGDHDADRWVDPANLAEVIAFLASDAARDVRGAAMSVYGNV